jgi:hypothetical protein
MTVFATDTDAIAGIPDPVTATVRVFMKYEDATEVMVKRVVGDKEEPFRQMNPWIGDFAGGVRDYECPLDIEVLYRAYAFDENGDPIDGVLESPPFVLDSYTEKNGGASGCWLRPITRPGLGLQIDVSSWQRYQSTGRAQTFDVLNQRERVAVTMARDLYTSTLQIYTYSMKEESRMNNILGTGEPLVFLHPYEYGNVTRNYLVGFRVADTRVSTFAAEETREWAIEVEEIAYPSGTATPTVFNKWDDVEAWNEEWVIVGEEKEIWVALPETYPIEPLSLPQKQSNLPAVVSWGF